MKWVVMFSGGICSWAAAKRTVERYGADSVTLLFTDTKIEDPDLYRFIEQGSANVGAPLVWISEGRTPWEVFRDEKILGNSRIDPCSRVLKREPAEKWLKENCDPATTEIVFGVAWDEFHRFDAPPLPNDPKKLRRGVKNRYARMGWPNVSAPMTEAPYLDRQDMLKWVRSEGIEPPRLYGLGFAHNNCGGGCVKAGKGHFTHLLKALPEVYAEWEAREAEYNARRPGKRRETILRDEKAGRPTELLSLKELRERVESRGDIDLFEIGGCGCFLDEVA